MDDSNLKGDWEPRGEILWGRVFFIIVVMASLILNAVWLFSGGEESDKQVAEEFEGPRVIKASYTFYRRKRADNGKPFTSEVMPPKAEVPGGGDKDAPFTEALPQNMRITQVMTQNSYDNIPVLWTILNVQEEVYGRIKHVRIVGRDSPWFYDTYLPDIPDDRISEDRGYVVLVLKNLPQNAEEFEATSEWLKVDGDTLTIKRYPERYITVVDRTSPGPTEG